MILGDPECEVRSSENLRVDNVLIGGPVDSSVFERCGVRHSPRHLIVDSSGSHLAARSYVVGDIERCEHQREGQRGYSLLIYTASVPAVHDCDLALEHKRLSGGLE